MVDKARTVVALIPARLGSQRVRDKNIRKLARHPLLAYAISSALESGIFADVIVSTDSEKYAEIARYYGAEVPFLRPREMASAISPDIEWVQYTLSELSKAGRRYDCFSILRPTSPFRRAETIRRAWAQFLADPEVDSLRAVELCKQHPGKMWRVEGDRLVPLLSQPSEGPPFHSRQYAALPPVYVQNASLEIAWCRVALRDGSIAGDVVAPFFTEGWEGEDVNDEMDWDRIVKLVDKEPQLLPSVPCNTFSI